MRVLPNGITIFNATPHLITFEWEGDEVFVAPDEVISAEVIERPLTRGKDIGAWCFLKRAEFVTPEFVPTYKGRDTVRAAYAAGADLVVGSIIAAQAYPGEIVAMVPAPGYERVPPAEKRMRADKFTCYTRQTGK